MLNAVLSAVTVSRISKRKAERKLSKTPFSFENPGNILNIFIVYINLERFNRILRG